MLSVNSTFRRLLILKHTQAEVLNALVARAANFAPRIVLFVVKGTNALAWAARGLDETIGNTSVRGLTVSLQSDTVLRGALNAQQTFYGSPDQQTDNPLIFGKLGNLQPQRVLAVPLKVRGKAAAIIYADSAERGEAAINVEAIELLVNTAGMVVELVSLRARMAEGTPAARPSAPTPPAATQVAPPTPAPPPAPPVVAQQPVPAPPPVAERPAPPTPPAPAADWQFQAAGAPEPPPPAPSFFVPTAEPPQEVRSSPPPSRVSGDLWGARQSGHLNAPLVEPPRPVDSAPSLTPRSAADMSEEEKAHNDARRFARLLVSEIKLYNEQKVAEGRIEHDLYDRLREYIDRSREMYDKRVKAEVASRYDYFHGELVNTLAEGDVSKLGANYPGATVNA